MQDIGFVHVAPTVIKMSFGILGSGHQLKFVWSLNVLARRHLCVAHTQHNAHTSWLKAYICLLVDAYQFYVQCLFGLKKTCLCTCMDFIRAHCPLNFKV